MKEMIALDPTRTIGHAFPALGAAWSAPLLRSGIFRRALRVPLFTKLFVANAAILLLLGSGAVLVSARIVRIGNLPPAAVIELLMVALLFVTAFANALLIRLALSPLSSLEDAARRVQEGNASARAPESPLADADLARVIELFNQVLDFAEADRAHRTRLSLRVLQAEERERERVGRAIYAGIAQTLAGVLVRMRLLSRSRDGEAGSSALDELRGEVASALEEVRSTARRLHPPELGDLGVAAALEAHARHMTAERPMQVIFEGTVPEDYLPDGAALVLFRVVQEALSNAVLHSGGSVIRTRFQSTATDFLAEVVDDGRGFNPDRTLFSGEGGLGLLGMRERAGYVAGSLSVESGPGRGTRVRLRIPWKVPGGAPRGSLAAS